MVDAVLNSADLTAAGGRLLADPDKGPNRFVNSQFQARTAMNQITAFKLDGTQFSAFTMTSHTTGSNTVVATLSSTTGLRVGMIGIFGGAADASLIAASAATPGVATACEITALTSTTITIDLPRGIVGAGGGGGTFTPIMMGDVTGSTNAGPDGVYKATTLDMWIEDDPTVIANYPGAARVIGWKKRDGNPAVIATRLNNFANTLVRLTPFRGRPVAAGFQGEIKSGSGTMQAIIQHGIGPDVSAFGTSFATSGWSEVTTTIRSDSTSLNAGAYITGTTGTWGYFGLPCLYAGVSVGGAAAYSKPPREVIPLRVKMTPVSYFGADLTLPASEPSAGLLYPVKFRLYPETNGVLTKDIGEIDIVLEGKQATANASLAVRNQIPVPHLYGPLLFAQVNTRMIADTGVWRLYGGEGAIFSDTASAPWTSVSIDIDGVTSV